MWQIIAAAISAGATVYGAKSASDAQKKALKQAKKDAEMMNPLITATNPTPPQQVVNNLNRDLQKTALLSDVQHSQETSEGFMLLVGAGVIVVIALIV